MRRDAFSGYHPATNLLFFTATVLLTIFIMNPAILAISFAAAFSYSVYLGAAKALRFNLLVVFPLMLIAAAVNVLFVHRGVTTLGYLHGNPITLESVTFGVCMAVMIGSVIMWFSCYNIIMTSDKFLYIFGGVIPSLSLVISMALRFIPHYKVQMRKMINARKGIEPDAPENKKLLARAKDGAELFSAMLTWALENSIDTADSMRARGYGSGKRTNYGDYEVQIRDIFAMTLFLLTSIVAGFGLLHSYQYYPLLIAPQVTGLAIPAYALFFLSCFSPIALGIAEDIAWRRSIEDATWQKSA
jgi:energy-coupling factor transport system permease protein